MTITTHPVDGINYTTASEETGLSAPGVTSWVRLNGDVMAGIGGTATSVDAKLEVAIPLADSTAGSVVLADPTVLSAVNVSLGLTVNIYSLPGPVLVRWNITAVSGGAAKPCLSGKAW